MSERPRPAGLDRCWTVLLVGLAALTAALFAYPLSHLTSPVSFNYSEGWNSFWDTAASMRQPLYAAPPDLTIANYPPLSFHLVGWLGRSIGDVTVAGRVVGLIGLGWSAVNVGMIAAWAGSRRSGWLAALCLLLWIALLTPGRIGTNDPHFLALALATAGLHAVVAARGRRGWIVAAATCFVLALFVKNSLVAFPAASALYLALTRRFRSLALFAATGLLLGLLLLGLTLVVDGPFFFAHLLAARALDRGVGLENLGTFATLFYAPVAIGLAGLLWRGRDADAVPALGWACAALAAAAFGFGNGVTYNIQYETLAAMAIVVAGAVDAAARQAGAVKRGWVLVAALVLLAVGSVLVRAPAELYGALGRSARLPQREADGRMAVDLLRAAPGPALCESLLLCLQAGKPFVFDPYFVKDQIRVGRVAEARIVAELNARRFGAVEIGEDDADIAPDRGERLRFTAGVMAALLDNYRVVWRRGYYAVLLPR